MGKWIVSALGLVALPLLCFFCVNHHARALVEHQQNFVLEKDVERDFFRLRFGRFGLRPMDFHLFPGTRRVSGLDGAAIHPYVAFFDQALDRSARHRWELAAQKSIQPLRRKRSLDNDNLRAIRHTTDIMPARRWIAALSPSGIASQLPPDVFRVRVGFGISPDRFTLRRRRPLVAAPR